MENFPEESGIRVDRMHILDIGASTEGLRLPTQRGATNATCIDG